MCRFIIFLYVICGLFIFSACGRSTAVFVDEQRMSTEIMSETLDFTMEETDINKEIAVYICGAVVNQGVYYLPQDSIKQDALNLAGGFADGAASTYVNLAEVITEGEKIYIPYEEELEAGYTPISIEANEESGNQGKININSATADELMTLPGIGKNKADLIIKYRNSNGMFNSIEDIKLVSGIKNGVYDQIKEYICVN